tara:strand:+ start:141 stop:812 length:672 start_codon:yes stop_codon:yes gene_type:complete
MKTRRQSIGIIRVTLFSLLTLIGCAANTADASTKKVYKLPIISDVDTVTEFTKNLKLSNKTLKLSLVYESVDGKPIPYIYRSHNPKFVEQIIVRASKAMDGYLRSIGIKQVDCRGNDYNLVVTVVSRSVLQDDKRFRDFYKTKFGVERLEHGTLYGYYDSTPEIIYNSSIMLTDVNKQNEEVLAHELAHYYWDRMCVGKYLKNTSSEAFAVAFDKYYYYNWRR